MRNSVFDNDRHQAEPLTTIYSKLPSFATNDTQPILDVTQEALRGTHYEILVNSVSVESMEWIDQERSSIYGPGQTDSSHKVRSKWRSSYIVH